MTNHARLSNHATVVRINGHVEQAPKGAIIPIAVVTFARRPTAGRLGPAASREPAATHGAAEGPAGS